MDEHDITEQAFKNGYEKGKQDAVKWIPVSEPPKKDGRYLVYDGDTGNYYDSYFDENEGEFGEWQNCFDPFTLGVIDCVWNSYPNVTHWMQLPEPPKGE